MDPKTLHNSDISGVKVNVPDVAVVGNGDLFQLLCKASSKAQGWMKSTKAMEIPGIGCIVQVTTQQQNPDGSYAVAEAVTFVTGVRISEKQPDGGRHLVAIGYGQYLPYPQPYICVGGTGQYIPPGPSTIRY
jgi:hypothetical protein